MNYIWGEVNPIHAHGARQCNGHSIFTGWAWVKMGVHVFYYKQGS